MNFFKKNWIVTNLLLAIVIFCVVMGGLSFGLKKFTEHNKYVEVPDFIGMSMDDAAGLASKDHLKLIVTDSVFVNRFRHGAIYAQTPKAGSEVKDGRKIYITVNAVRKRQVPMPSLVGLTVRQAKVELAANGLALGTLLYVRDLATNNVLGQMVGASDIAPGTKVDVGTVVNLKVGANPSDAFTVVPSFVELPYMKAVNAVQDSYLNVEQLVFDSTVRTYSDSLAAFVYRQVPHESEDRTSMGRGVKLYLTLDREKLPKPEPVDSLALIE